MVLRNNPEIKTKHQRVYKRLAEIVGAENVTDNAEDLFLYSSDFMTTSMLETGISAPDYVVSPLTTEEVSAIMRLANREIVPVTPCIANKSVGAQATPSEGGIVLDLKRMNKIEVHEKARMVIVGGGSTLADVARYMRKNYPDLEPPFPHSTPGCGILGSILQGGITSTTKTWGISGPDIVGALEVILPTGEIVRTGSCSTSDTWFTDGPSMPYLTGLFLGWGGTTGVVTRAALKLYEFPKFSHGWNVGAPAKTAYDLELDLCRSGFIDSCTCTGWGWVKLAAGYKEPITREPSGEIEWEDIYLAPLVTASSEKELDAKIESFKKLTAKYDNLQVWEPDEFGKNLPKVTPCGFETGIAPYNIPNCCFDGWRAGGGEWAACYMPMDRLYEGHVMAEKIYEEFNLPPMIWNKPLMDAGQEFHQSYMRFNISLKKGDQKHMKKMRRALRKIYEGLFSLGGVPKMAPVSIQKLYLQKQNPATVDLMRRIRRMLDPNRIMNPGKWEI